MKKRLIFPLSFAVAALFGGCIWHFLSARKGTMQLLEQAEAVMREHPDSAYRLLCGIDSTRQLRGESRARYALLMTQAQYKNGVPLPNDSLIGIAYDYYCASSDSLHKAWACFYMGQAARDGGNQRDALRYFQQAASAGESTKNYNLLALIYQHWGNMLKPITPYEEGKRKLINAQEYATLANDTPHIILCILSLSRSYLYLKEHETNFQQLEKGRVLAKEINDTSLLFNAYAESAFAYDEGNNYNIAWRMLDTAKHYMRTIKDSDCVNLYNVYLFNHMHQYDSALHYMKQIKDSSTLTAKADNHHELYKIEKGRGNLPVAFYHLEKYAELFDSIYLEDNKNDLTFLQRHYDYSHYKIQNLHMQTQRRMLWVTILCLATFIICISFLIYIRHNRRKRYIDALIRSKDALIQENTLKLSKINDKLQQQNQELQNAKLLLKQQKQQLEEQIQQIEEKEELQATSQQLQHQLDDNQRKQDELKERVFHINESVQKVLEMGERIKRKNIKKLADLKLNEKEYQNLFSAFDLCYNDMITRLKSENPQLTPNDLLYCCLLKMNTNQELIYAMLSTNPTALKKRRYRIKNEKIEQAHSYTSLEAFLQQF